MREKALKVLEYNKIIDLLKAQAGSETAKNIISEFKPFCDINLINDGLKETTEAVSLIIAKGPLPLGSFYDIDSSVRFAKKGGVLTMRQLLHIRHNLIIAEKTRKFIKSDLTKLPLIDSICEVIVPATKLEHEIDRCIISEDEMADNASPELRSIRRAIVRQNDALRSRINRIINSSANEELLQDSIVTIRDGRYVIPVKQEHKSKVPGMIHDQSATGATVFIEPQVVVDLNNELKELAVAEKAEIDKILMDLSNGVSEHYNDLLNNQKLLVQLDIIMAKGKLSVMQRGEPPEIVEESSELILKGARHPLIEPSKVVPINVSVGGDYRTLVITGPNTGGKTVTLKTLGLLVMMAQTGLHLPAASGSRLPIFKEVFADIGDEQSIEQSLSTFSSHMKNIVEIVAEADENCLVLLDELGAGTDPTEGAALAIAILEHLYSRGARTVATTHYTELKKYAVSTDGVENASMEFDLDTLSPTYRLSIGIPGKSNAFEISKKLGLLTDITDKAMMLLDGGDIEFEDVISALDADRKAAEEERDEAIMLNIAVKKKKEEIEKKERHLKDREEKILSDAKEQAGKIINDAKATVKEVREELRALNRIDSIGERNKKLHESRKRLKDAAGRYRERIVAEVNDNPVSPEDLKLGDRVKLLKLGQNGEIIGLPNAKGKLHVQVGGLKITANVSEIMLVDGGVYNTNRPKKVNSYGSMYKQKAQSINKQIDVRGMNLSDALMECEKYIDDAMIAGIEKVTIIHGYGEGVLQKGIREMLKKHKSVKSCSKGGFHDGGEGITVVEMKK